MPIFDQGYQHWSGRLSGHATRWMAITAQGVRAQWKNRWVKGVVFASWLPALVLGGFLAIWGLFEQQSSFIAPIMALFQGLPEELKQGPKGYRTTVWTLFFYVFFNVQVFFSMLIVLLVGPDLISQDLRFNAIPLYFARPLRRIDYFLGKLGVIAVFVALVTIVPPLLAYGLGLAFSLDPEVVPDTFRLLAGGLGYGLIVVLSAGTLMLAISSLTRNSRYVGAMWMGIWIVSGIAAEALENSVRADWCPLVSYTQNLYRVREEMLDLPAARVQILELIEASRREAERAANPLRGGLFGLGRRRRPTPPPPPTPPGEVEPGETPDGDPDPETGPRRPRRPRGEPPFVPAVSSYPWTWSAGVLTGLFGLSAWTLSRRVKTLDRLK